MMNPLVSVIIVNWNGYKWLSKLLNSIESQTYNNFEIILVDNGSTDNSVEFVEQEYKTVKIIKNGHNYGFAKGNNIGVRSANGSLIMLVNSDTWLNSGLIASLVAEKHDRKLDVIAPRESDYMTADSRPIYITKIDIFGHPIFLYGLSRQLPFYLSGVCMLFEKTLYDKTGGLDDTFFMYCEEVDWFWRLKLYEYKYDYSYDQTINHFGGGSSNKGINVKVFRWRNENTLRMLIKNYGTLPLMVALPLLILMNTAEAVAFIIIGKINIAKTYYQAWITIFNDRKNLLTQRRYIQQQRTVGEMEILKSMYIGIAKIHHLAVHIRRIG
jgi:GT2 family glycosyltransferase